MAERGDVEQAIELLLREVGATRARRLLAERAGLRFDRGVALHDELTGVANRSLLFEQVVRALARHRRHGGTVAVLFLDVDGLEQVNETLGRDAGDDALLAIAERLTDVVRPTDTVSRLGGDEFVVVLEGFDDERDAARVAQRIAARLAEPIKSWNNALRLGVSIGLAFATPGIGPDELVGRADAARRRAHELGGDRVEIFDDEL